MGESCYILKMVVQDAFVINGADQSKNGLFAALFTRWLVNGD